MRFKAWSAGVQFALFSRCCSASGASEFQGQIKVGHFVVLLALSQRWMVNFEHFSSVSEARPPQSEDKPVDFNPAHDSWCHESALTRNSICGKLPCFPPHNRNEEASRRAFSGAGAPISESKKPDSGTLKLRRSGRNRPPEAPKSHSFTVSQLPNCGCASRRPHRRPRTSPSHLCYTEHSARPSVGGYLRVRRR